MIRVCHLSSVHAPDDVRIFHKECRSLAEAGFDTHFVVPAEKDAVRDGVHIHAVKRVATGRLRRMLLTAFRVYRVALMLRARVYHFHDPELLPWGLLLRLSGAHVIYDVHEDLPRDVMSKDWIPAWLRRPVSWVVELLENFLARRMSLVVAATPHIRGRFLRAGCRSIDVNNYPLLGELAAASGCGDFSPATRPHVCYAGGISRARGSREMVVAVARAGVRLQLAGTMAPGERNVLTTLKGWSSVDELGFLSRAEVAALYARCFAGLVVLHPEPNYLMSQPIKMYEYMSAGIPVIASDFPLWRSVIEAAGCGICVDPADDGALVAAIRRLDTDRELGKRMGECGRRAVYETYNWGVEGQKLVAAYRNLCGIPDA